MSEAPQANPLPPPHDPVLARVCHDLRTPLTAALGHTQLLRRRLHQGSPGALDHAHLDHGLAAIERALARMAAVVNRLDPPRPPRPPT